jgi:hypothetical protein
MVDQHRRGAALCPMNGEVLLVPTLEVEIRYAAVDGGQALRIEVRTAEGMEIFRRALREMATGRVEMVNFGGLPGVSALQGILLFLTLVSEEPKVTVMKVIRSHDLKRGLGPEFTWRRSREGWRMCAELAEKLGAGRRQSFSEEGDTVEIEVGYEE